MPPTTLQRMSGDGRFIWRKYPDILKENRKTNFTYEIVILCEWIIIFTFFNHVVSHQISPWLGATSLHASKVFV